MSANAYALSGKTAIVTGSSRGIGRAIAKDLALRGANVVINYVKSKESAEALAAEITAEAAGNGGVGKTLVAQADTSDVKSVNSLFEAAKAEFGKIDIVISNAGTEAWAHVSEITEADFDRVFSVNVKGQLFVAQAAYKHVEVGGRLVLMSSISAQARAVRNHSVYQASKAAVEALARSLPADFGDRRITVNAIAPGGIKSDMYVENARHYVPGGDKMSDAEVEEKHAALSPLKRVGVPQDVAGVVAFLVGEDGAWMNGQVLTIAGGVPYY